MDEIQQQKKCSKCQQIKNLSEFSTYKKTKSGVRAWCKECHNKYYNKYFDNSNNMEKQVQRVEKCHKLYRKNLAEEKCKLGCCICGYNKHGSALEYHHINKKDKLFEISTGFGRSKESVELEKKKCVVVCANCHREITAGLIKI